MIIEAKSDYGRYHTAVPFKMYLMGSSVEIKVVEENDRIIGRHESLFTQYS